MVFNRSLEIWQMLVQQKPVFDRYCCINGTTKAGKVFWHYLRPRRHHPSGEYSAHMTVSPADHPIRQKLNYHLTPSPLPVGICISINYSF